MTNRSRSRLGISVALCLVAALAAWGCDQGGSGPGTPAGPSSATAAAKSGGSGPAETPTQASSQAPSPSPKKPPTEPDPELVLVLTEALQDEYHAEWAYQDVLDAFGNVKPFTSIHQAELNHIDAASKLFTKRGWNVPSSEWLDDDALVFASVTAACAAGVDAELANIAMYEKLLGGDLPDDVVKVFTKLMEASQDNHLPAFTKCASK